MDRNIFVLSADSLNQQAIADDLAEVAEIVDGTVFSNAVATATETRSAIPGLVAGVYDDTLANWGLPEHGEPKPLFEIVNESGGETGLFCDNVLFSGEYNYDRGVSAGNAGAPTTRKNLARKIRDGPLNPLFGLLELAYFSAVQPATERLTGYTPFYRDAADLHSNASAWLNTNGQSVGNLCWIHYMDTHHPYEPPDSYLSDASFSTPRTRPAIAKLTRNVIKSNGEGYDEKDISDVQTAYQASCEYLGDELIQFIESLSSEKHFQPDRDILIITADHGECLRPETGMLGHTPPAFYEDIINVPLLIAAPQWENKYVDHQVSLIDLLPTVTHLAELPQPPATDGDPADSPDELQRDTTYSITKSNHEDGWEVFRCVRSQNGNKKFGRFDGETVLTSWEEGEVYSSESVINDPDTKFNELSRVASERGGFLEVTAQSSTNNQLPEEHLRDLGYLK
jgi:arylsulfatase A-like enzyme